MTTRRGIPDWAKSSYSAPYIPFDEKFKDGCHLHGKRYPLVGSPMCSHPTCMEKWVRTCGKRNGYVGRCVAMLDGRQMLGDFVSTVFLEYLKQFAQGRGPMLRVQWIAYEMSNYMRKRKNWQRNEVLVDPLAEVRGGSYADLPEATVEAEELVQEHLGEIGAEGTFSHLSRTAEVRELTDHIVAMGGAVSLLVIREDITLSDAWLLDDRKRKMGQTMAQRALEVEFCLCWVRQWAQYVRREDGDGGRFGTTGCGRERWGGDGFDPDDDTSRGSAAQEAAELGADVAAAPKRRRGRSYGRGHGDVGVGFSVGSGAV